LFRLDQLLFVLFGFSLDTFDQSLFLLNSSLFHRNAILSLDFFDLLLYFRFGDESFGESLEVGREED
jgi:hypothetical protein